ncbi:MAG: N-acetylglucosamine-6-phosphate deacetylase [Acidobacteria bacterium 13_1_40CM_2_60_7]|nr:MAG: N-acetylglucosamine-6-phosphate deacetylase [Acidobacteria bacterium 13_1_40CM_2_60_7]PYU05809.1 MAG: N-acetylglucosamine-6-phosphate deacetylase [Acidobacteriota bacterium]
MTTLLLHAGRAVTPAAEISDAGILIHDGTIEAVGPRQALRLPAGAEEIREPEAIAIPGFVDVHIHGAGGSDVMEGTRQAIGTVARTIAEHGTTSFLATTVTASAEDTSRSIEGISHYIEHQHEEDAVRSEVLGIHFEGPFLSPTRRGVHPQEWLQLPSVELLARFLKVARGTARLLTIAPELPGAPSCIEAAHTAGLVVAMGHTDANYEQTRAAIARGVRHAVHVYNAMRPFTHRDPGVIGAVLTSPEVTAELIADGVHVEDGAMRLLLQAKGVERVILVSDGTAATGMPDGKYKLGPLEVTVSGGICRNAEGKLAGSTLTLDRALRNIVALGFSLPEAVRMLTQNTALLLGLEFKKGALRPGADADIVLLDSSLQIRRVWTRGITS